MNLAFQLILGGRKRPFVPPVEPTAVAWQSLTANGTSGSVSTNQLIATFDTDPGLNTSNFVVTGASKGVVSKVGAVYTVNINTITVSDGQSVTLDVIGVPSGFTITPTTRTVPVYKSVELEPPTFEFDLVFPILTEGDTGTLSAADCFAGEVDSYSIATGTLPEWLTFNTSTGVFTYTDAETGNVSGISVTATNTAGSATTNTASIVIGAAIEEGDLVIARNATTTSDDAATYTIVIDSSMTTAPNPASIVFNALIGSTFPGIADPEKQLSFWWGFGDAGATFDYVASTWGRNNANRAQGGITGHVFENVGSYTVKCFVYNHDTGAYGYAEQVITVTDADLYYATTDTICLDPSSTFAGVPAGSQQVTSWNAAQTAIETIKAGSRLLIARGQTLNLDHNSTLLSIYNNQRYGAFGDGAEPIINLPTEGMDNFASAIFYGSAGTSRGTGENTVISDWDIRGNYDAELGIGEANNSNFANLDGNSKVGFHNVKVSGIGKALSLVNVSGLPDRILISNCQFTNWFDYGILGRGSNTVIVGSSIKQKATAGSGKNAKEKFQGRIESNGTQTVYVLANLQLHGETDKYLRVFDYEPSARTYRRLFPGDDFTFTEGVDDDGNNTGNATHEADLNSAIDSGHELYYHSAYYPWHGPIRMENCQGVTIAQNEFLSKNGWTSSGLAHQPCIRWNSGGNANAFGFINQNKIEGGFDMLALAPQNSTTRQFPTGPLIVEANEFVGTTVSENCIRIGCTNVLARNNNMIQPNIASEWENHEFQRFAIIEKYEATQNDVDADPIDIYNNTIVNLMTTANGARDIVAVFESPFGDGFPLVNSGNNLLYHDDNSVALPNYSPLDADEYYRPLEGSAAINGGTPNSLVWDDIAGELVGENASIGSYDQPAVEVVTPQRLTLNGVDSKFSFPDKTLGDGDSVSFIFNSTDFSCYLLGRDGQTQHFIVAQNGSTIRVRAVTNHYFDVAEDLDAGEDILLTYTHHIGTAPTLSVDGTPYTERDGTVGTTALILNQSNFGNGTSFNTISHSDLTFVIGGVTTKWNIDSGSITTEESVIGEEDMIFTGVELEDWA